LSWQAHGLNSTRSQERACVWTGHWASSGSKNPSLASGCYWICAAPARSSISSARRGACWLVGAHGTRLHPPRTPCPRARGSVIFKNSEARRKGRFCPRAKQALTPAGTESPARVTLPTAALNLDHQLRHGSCRDELLVLYVASNSGSCRLVGFGLGGALQEETPPVSGVFCSHDSGASKTLTPSL
jgi:hypothetical protein